MYKSLSSMFFYILCIHLCSTEELGAVSLSTRSTRWLILVQPQLSSYLFFLSNAFSDCGQNGFCLQAELFLFAIRKNSACSQKNFWLHRTESEAVNIKQEEQQEYHTRFCKISEVVWILSQICLKISFSVYLKSFLASFPSRFLQGQCQRAHVSLLTMHCECSLSSLEINRPLFAAPRENKSTQKVIPTKAEIKSNHFSKTKKVTRKCNYTHYLHQITDIHIG